MSVVVYWFRKQGLIFLPDFFSGLLEMKEKATSITKNALIIAVGKGMELVIILISAALLARFLGVRGYGEFAFIRAIGMMVMPIIGLSAFTILIREISVDPGQTGLLVTSSFLLSLLSFTVLMLGTWVFFILVPSSNPVLPACLYLVLVAHTLMVMQRHIFAVFIAAERVIYSTILQLGRQITLVSLYLIVIVLHLELIDLFWALVVANVLILGAAWIVLLRNFSVSIPIWHLKLIPYLAKES